MKFQILLALLVLVSAPAFAGFSWIPGSSYGSAPSGGGSEMTSPNVLAMPVPPVSAGPLTPDLYHNDMPMAGSMHQSAMPSGNVVQGFGKGIPLSVALPQILPAGKTFNITQGVDANAKISWQGGYPWQETLNNALAEHGLSYADNGASVSITRGGSSGGGNLGMALPVSQNFSASVPVPAPDMKQQLFGSPSTFAAAPGQNLSQVLALWAQQQNIKFLWRAPRDYTVTQGISMNASFDRAVENLMGRYQNMSPQPVATLYPNLPNGPAVLVVQ